MRPTLLLLAFFAISIVYAQKDYPVPAKNAGHLFYIQHSNNHNTYVYDANMNNGVLDTEDPVKEYRVMYTQGGVVEPLGRIQKKLAYGIKVVEYRDDTFVLNLAASKKLKLYLEQDTQGIPHIYVYVNNKMMRLKRIYLQLKKGGLNAEADYAIFYGNDYETNAAVEEKVVPRP